jgi:hypothetical protein
MLSVNLFLSVALGLMFPVLVWGAFKRPALGLGLLLLFLPAFSFARRLDVPFFPSLETIAVMLLWGCVQVRSLKHGSPHGVADIPVKIAILVFFTAGLLSSMAARDPDLSLKILLAGGLVPWLCYSIASRYARTVADMEYVVYGFLGLAIQAAVFTVVTFDRRQSQSMMVYGDQELYTWMYSQAPATNLFIVASATVSVIVSAIPLATWYLQYGKWQRPLVWVVISIGVAFTALLSLSRGSWLGTLVAVVGSLPLIFKQARVSRVMLIIAIIIVIYFAVPTDFVRGIVLFRIEGSSFGNIDSRQANYMLALQSASGHIVAGVGLGQYARIYWEFPRALASRMPPLWFAHSLFLTLIPEIGLLGAAAFFYLFLSRLMRGIRPYQSGVPDKVRALAYASSVGVVSYMAIASASGTHLVAALRHDAHSTYLIAPALIVACALLGIITAATEKQPSAQPVRPPLAQPGFEAARGSPTHRASEGEKLDEIPPSGGPDSRRRQVVR